MNEHFGIVTRRVFFVGLGAAATLGTATPLPAQDDYCAEIATIKEQTGELSALKAAIEREIRAKE
jgi:hypothetical protein